MSRSHDFDTVPELVEVVETLPHGGEHGTERDLLPGIMEYRLIVLHIHTPVTVHPYQIVNPIHKPSPLSQFETPMS